MTASAGPSLIDILRSCEAAAPEPWYPSVHARTQGIDRDSLDSPLERLRLGGLIHLTDWVQGTGQGYRLTDEGRRVLQAPRDLQRLERDQLPESQPPAAATPAEAPNTYERGEILRAALENRVVPYVSYGLLLAVVGVFGVGAQLARQEGILDAYLNSPSQPAVHELLHRLGALRGADLVRGEWWRLLSCCFVHIGLIHLAVNGITLFSLGPFLEQLWGRARFLAVYLIAGFVGSCAMVLTHPTDLGAGASGALWGLMLSLATWVFLNRRHLPPINPAWVRRFLFIILLNVFISTLPNISAAAHFAGGGAGVAVSVLLNLERFSVGPRRALLLLLTALLPASGVGAVAWQMRHDPHWRALECDAFMRTLPNCIKGELDTPTRYYDEHLRELLDQRADQREPARVEKALADLTRHRVNLSYFVDRLDQMGPYHEPSTQQALQTARTALRETLAFYGLVDRALRADAAEPVPNAELNRRKDEVNQLARKWYDSWKSFLAARRELYNTANR
ncbi:MAG: rhomboid family intramembrane serine protease [Planctomycetia bacterium]|nr:rhomboid family intramembrane serine protease [Planctomycetia bacterium]